MIQDNVIIKQLDSYPDIMEIKTVAKYLSCSNNTVYNLLKSGELKGYKMGKAWKISKENLIDYAKRVGLFT